MKKVVFIHNIATAYYKNIVFNSFYEKHNNLKVIHLAETEKRRDWKVDLSDIKYPYEVLSKGCLDDVSNFKLLKKILIELNRELPDIVYLGGYYQAVYWFALLWAKIKKKKVIVEMDSNEFDHKRYFLKELIKKAFIKLCDAGLTYGQTSKSYLKQLGMKEERITIKPNVTHKDLFDKSLRKERPKEYHNKYNFLYVGRFSKEKNLIFLLDSFEQVNKGTDAQWGLILIGSGPQEEELKSYLSEHGINNVSIISFIDKSELVTFYSHADLFVLPSISEPWGLVVNEAMACGLPVVVSKHCGCHLDLVRGNGFTFDPLDKAELSLILSKYINNKVNITLQKERSLKIISDYTPEKAAEKIKICCDRIF